MEVSKMKTLLKKVLESTGIESRWNTLSPEKKRKLIIGLSAILFFVGLMIVFAQKEKNVKRSEAEKPTQTEVVEQEEDVDTDLLKKTQYYETMKMYDELSQNLKKIQEELQKEKEERKKKEEEIARLREELEKTREKMEEGKKMGIVKTGKNSFSGFRVPPPPPPSKMAAGSKNRGKNTIQVEIIGGIGEVSASIPVEKKKKEEELSQKEVKKKYYLPPSFMEATLLSGLDAPAVGEGKASPVPVLLRVKAPAILPNKVRANLKGCFIIAEGIGNLATERADIRLVSLSCIDYKGRAVIDQPVKGFVVDTDGKIGLRGRVVSKMGSVLARSLLAGFVSGVSQAFSMQAQTFSVTPQGTVSTVKPEEIFKFGAAQGFTSAANELVKFYMELARQTIPVVEILPTRTVTVVISKGTYLTLKEMY